MDLETKHFYQFGNFRLDAARRVLLHGEKPVALAPKVLETLVVLVSRHGELVEKDELLNAVWPDTFVEEANLAVNISLLRKALENGSPGRDYIETVPKRGYRFVAPVFTSAAPGDARVTPVADARGSKLAAGITIVLLLFAAAAVLRWDLGRRKVSVSTGPIRTLAVLPFENLSGDAAQDYAVDGLTEALVTDLAQIHSLSVISRTSVMHYKGTHKTVPQIGRELNTDGIVEGSVVLSGERVRVTAQLIDARSDKHLWARAFEGNRKEMFDIQNQAARAIAEEVQGQISPAERIHLAAAYMPSAEAYEGYLRGRYLLSQRTPPMAREALAQFEQATRIDPRYAQAYAGLADAYVVLLSYDTDPRGSGLAAKGKAAAVQALSLDDASGHTHTALAHLKVMDDWDFAGAEEEYRRGLALNPSDATAHHWYGVMLMYTGRNDEAEREFQIAAKLDPVSLVIPCALGLNYLFVGRFDEAAAQARKALALDPHNANAHYLLGGIYEAQGKFDVAVAEFQKYMDSSGHNSDTVARLAAAYAMAGQSAEARKLFAELQHPPHDMNVPPTDLAVVYSALGDRDQALASLERGFRDRCTGMILLLMDTAFWPLRGDPRFEDVLRRVGFPAAAIHRWAEAKPASGS